MPAEWVEHMRTWMAWPSALYTLGETRTDANAAYAVWSSVANAIVNFEPVTMLANSRDIETARRCLDPRVEIVECELNDGWMRDIGPTFVKDENDNTVAIDWVFNGWGSQGNWAAWEKDDKVANFISSRVGSATRRSWLVNEGGGIHVNGTGKVLLTETVQLGNGRNPGKTKAEVEAEIHAQLGTSEAIWIKRGLTRDYEDFGTLGHIDIVACFVAENRVLFHDQTNPEHPDFAISHEVKATLEAAGLETISLPAPTTLRDHEGFVDYSYVNHYLVNGGVILCAFDDEMDARAKAILESCYPDRKVVMVDARELFARGGGIHCITQQQPK